MQFTTSAAAFLALMSHALAQTSGFDAVTKPTSGEVLTAGSTYQVTWDYNSQYDGTISITLLQGDTDTTLEVGDTVASKSLSPCPTDFLFASSSIHWLTT